MSNFDMPLEKMRAYYGTNTKPQDFDEYWEKALMELNEVDPDVMRVKAPFQTSFASCYDLYFTGVRKARIHAKLIFPGNLQKKTPAVLMFHGYSCDSGEWNDKLQYAAAGFVVAALDSRGQGGLSEDVGGVKGTTLNGHFIRGLDGDPQDLLMRHNFLDCVQLARLVMALPEVDESRVYVTGGSQGGGLSLACAALEPRIAKVSICYPFLSDYKRVWDLDLMSTAYAELKDYFRHFDPLHEREKEIFTKLGYIDVHHLAGRIQAPVLMGISLADSTCPPSTQFAAFNQIRSPKKAMIYYDYGHEALPGFTDRQFQFLMDDGYML